jgi:hypothetical protein
VLCSIEAAITSPLRGSPFGLQNDCTQSDPLDHCSVPGAVGPGLAFDSNGDLFAPSGKGSGGSGSVENASRVTISIGPGAKADWL